ncbi:unnamed protein product [Larinioides sclopetarius]|uniref:Uncharacterized protein n=1 Tax=Larinioides sclopetarius TaxID=280406 RepID=A0AAV1ZAQ0_9ARAC
MKFECPLENPIGVVRRVASPGMTHPQDVDVMLVRLVLLADCSHSGEWIGQDIGRMTFLFGQLTKEAAEVFIFAKFPGFGNEIPPRSNTSLAAEPIIDNQWLTGSFYPYA